MITLINSRSKLADLSLAVYNNDPGSLSGFKYGVYRNGNDIALAFAGTDFPKLNDLILSDGMMAIGMMPSQYQEALNTYLDLKANNPNANITVTGHSLGGSLAQLVAASTGANAVTFNPYGVSNLLPQLGLRNDVPYPNIENYNLSSDLLNLANHGQGVDNIGKSYIIPVNGENPLESHNDFESLKTGTPITLEDWRKQNAGLVGTLQTAYKIGQSVFMGCLAKLPSGISLSLPSGLLDYFDKANGAGTPGADPILVDLNGDGIKTTTLENGIYFDHGKDGFRESSAWVDKEDGILAIDKNNNGIIDNGLEVFGDSYVKGDGSLASSGFDALADLDSNNDGIISNLDDNFGLIKILKGDGELISLEEAGIVSINLNNSNVNSVDENGNTLVSSSTFTKTDGTTGSLGDFNLVVDKIDSFAVNWIDESEDVSVLPDVMGCGTLHSLHQAMMRDKTYNGNLKSLVEQYVSLGNDSESIGLKRELTEKIIYRWCNTKDISDGSRGTHYDAKKLGVIERFMGERFKGVNNNGIPNIWAAPFLDNVYNMITNYVYCKLEVQIDNSFVKNIYDMFELEYDFNEEKVRYNFDRVIGYVDEKVYDFNYYLNRKNNRNINVA